MLKDVRIIFGAGAVAVDSKLQNCSYRPDLAAVEAKHACCCAFQWLVFGPFE